MKYLIVLMTLLITSSSFADGCHKKWENPQHNKLKNKTIYENGAHYKIRKVETSKELHSSRNFAVCNVVYLTVQNQETDEISQIEVRSNNPTYLSQNLIKGYLDLSGRVINDSMRIDHKMLTRSIKLTNCLDKTSSCSL